MAYQSLYRKYRPQVFADVVGQDHVTRTLRNAVCEDSVAHAYLFCGPRGTGKTTTARILAKALDCEQGPTPDPDNTCESCVEITEGRHPDVYELDAASRTGVDALRDEVISKVNYAATRGGYKVYIIDEVHMLSTSAFNALLKTLEEPPSKTVFVLCTTHPHKVPETIHSRCQRFDFRRIGTDDIVARLDHIARAERIDADVASLTLIAKHAAGGMRDAIGTLEQLSSFTGGTIAVEDVEGLLGEVDTARLFEGSGLIARRDVAGLFAFVARLVESGHDIPEFVRALTGHVRDLFVMEAAGGEPSLVDLTTADAARLGERASEMGLDRLTRVLDELGRLAGELRWSPDARLALEVALARIARPGSDLTLDSLAERVASLEAGATVAPSRPAAVSAPAPEPVAERPKPVRAAKAEPVKAAPAKAPVETKADVADPEVAPIRDVSSGDVAELRRRWPDVVRLIKESKPAMSQPFMETEPDVDGDTVVVEFSKSRKVLMRRAEDPEIVALVRDSIAHVLGWRVAVRYQLGQGAVRRDVEAASGVPPVSEAGSVGDHDELDRMLIEGLGAEVVETPAGQEQKGIDS